MKNKVFFVTVTTLLLAGGSLVFLFQNFSKISLEPERPSIGNVKTWQAKGLVGNSGVVAKESVKPCPESVWVLTLDLVGIIDGQSVSGEIVSEDTGEKVRLDNVRIPHTVGACESSAQSGQIKFCFENETGYNYHFELVDSSRKYGGRSKFTVTKELGCEFRPQQLRVSFSNGE